jgi:hypothetical protein
MIINRSQKKYNTQEINLLKVYQALIPIEKQKLTSKKNSKCVHKVSTKITMRKINDTRIFVNEVETQDEKNHSGAAKPRISTIHKTKLDTKQ